MAPQKPRPELVAEDGRLLCRPAKPKPNSTAEAAAASVDIFEDLTEPATNDNDTKPETKDEKESDLPRWATKPIVTLALKEYKNGSLLGVIKLGEKSRYILGREPKWVDVLLHHPSISRRQACLVHGTPPGTPKRYAKSATILDLGPGSTYYKKNRFAQKKHRIKPGKGVVLRKNMCFIFAKSTRVYEVIGLNASGSRIAKTQSSDEVKTKKLGNASIQRKLAILNASGAGKLKRTGETAFSNQFGRHSEYQHKKKMRVESTAKTVAMLEKKQKVAESLTDSKVAQSSLNEK